MSVIEDIKSEIAEYGVNHRQTHQRKGERMTREEAISYLNMIDFINGECVLATWWRGIDDDMRSAIEMAIEALSSEPCEDATSRAELLKAIDTYDKFGCDVNTKLVPYQDYYVPYIHYYDVVNCIKGMPPVTPQPKIGHWIFREIEDTLRWYECDQCGATVVKEYKYCPNCGAKMVGIKDKNGGKP